MWTLLMILFVFILFVVPSFKDRVIPAKKLFIVPAILMYLLYTTVNTNFHIYFTNCWLLTLGLYIGTAMGILISYKTKVKADKYQKLIWLPATYLNFILFLLIFSIHFAIKYLKEINPDSFSQMDIYSQVLLFLLSCISSITVGVYGCLYYKYNKAQYQLTHS